MRIGEEMCGKIVFGGRAAITYRNMLSVVAAVVAGVVIAKADGTRCPLSRCFQRAGCPFKLFSMTGGEKSAIMVYHGFPRADGSMEREFAAIYADLVRK